MVTGPSTGVRSGASKSDPPVPAPGPTGWKWIQFLRSVSKDRLRAFENLRDEYGNLCSFYNPVMRAPTYILSLPGYVERVLHTHQQMYRRADTYEFLQPLLGAGLLTSEGETWRRHRRLLAPMFHQKSIREFAQLMREETLTMMERWENKTGPGTAFDLSSEMTRLTLQIVGRALFSTGMKDRGDEVGACLRVVMREAVDRTTNPFKLPRWVPTPSNLEAKQATRTLKQVVKDLIERRRGGEDEYGDLLSMLMTARDEETGAALDTEQIRDEAMTFLMAGHETTANALNWTCYLLSEHPSFQKRLREEARSVPELDSDPFEALSELSLTERVLKEGMRLYPPAWVVERTPVEDDVIDGFHIPEGSILLLSPFLVHRNPDVWEQPETFDPDRFLPEREKQHHRFAYFPFGGGAHICIGREFAMMEGKLILSLLMRRFRLERIPDHPVEMEATVTLQPRHGLQMTFEPA